MGAISFEGVSKSYRLPDRSELRVLDRMTFDVERRAFTSILGPSGCGKSTILNLVAGLDRHYTGRIVLNGQPDAARRPTIGFVFQRPRLLDWRTVADNVLLPLEQERGSRVARRDLARRYLRLVGLDGYEDYHPLRLSAGMQQRVAIARALAVDPDVLLMDEPFSSLDELTGRRMRLELGRIWEETGKTIVFVTHSIGEAVFLSQRILILSQKPASVHRQVQVELPYPRQYGDVRLFEMETDLTAAFLEMEVRSGRSGS